MDVLTKVIVANENVNKTLELTQRIEPSIKNTFDIYIQLTFRMLNEHLVYSRTVDMII